MGLDDYEPEVEEQISDQNQLDHRKVFRIVRSIAKLKASYKSELSRYTAVDQNTLGIILYELLEAGILEKLTPKFKHNDDRLLGRKSDLRTKGITGIDRMRTMEWFALNSEREWFLKTNDGFYVDEYHRRYSPDELEEAKENLDDGKEEIGKTLARKMDLT